MKRPTPITAIAVSTAKPIAKPIRQPVGERRAQPAVGREYACAAMGDEATGTRRHARRRRDRRAASKPGSRATSAASSCRSASSGIAGGHSNLTYRVTDAGGQKWALRRPPMGKRLGSAHDMAREFKVVSALGETEFRWRRWSGSARTRALTTPPFT
jgi:hypothetical protein